MDRSIRRRRRATAAPTVLVIAGTLLLLAAATLAFATDDAMVGGHLDDSSALLSPAGDTSTVTPALDAAETDETPGEHGPSDVERQSAATGQPAADQTAEDDGTDLGDGAGNAEEGPVGRSVADPSELEIAAIGVRESLIGLDLDDRQRLEVPADAAVPGWYVRGPKPGEDGPAVIAGHVDSYQGPGVFWRLPELEPGDEIVVHRDDGSEVVFRVDRLGRWPKDEFPTDEVYREADGAELRLITCGGVFDENERSYRDNIIVFASAVDGA